MHRRTLLKAGLLAPAAAAPVVLGQPAADAAPRVGATLASGISYPWGIDFLARRQRAGDLRVDRRHPATRARDGQDLAGRQDPADEVGRLAAGRQPYGNRVFTRGHRNPEGLTMAPDGRLWSSELGENTGTS